MRTVWLISAIVLLIILGLMAFAAISAMDKYVL
jgi:hypothetical protein